MSDYRMNLNEFLSGSLWTTDGWENFSQFVGAVCRFVHAMTLFQQLKKLLDGDSWIRRTSEREDLPHQNPERPSGRDTQNTHVQHCVPEDHLITKNHQMYVWNLYCTSLIWSICQMQITAVFLSNRATNPASLIVPSHPQNSHEECFLKIKPPENPNLCCCDLCTVVIFVGSYSAVTVWICEWWIFFKAALCPPWRATMTHIVRAKTNINWVPEDTTVRRVSGENVFNTCQFCYFIYGGKTSDSSDTTEISEIQMRL